MPPKLARKRRAEELTCDDNEFGGDTEPGDASDDVALRVFDLDIRSEKVGGKVAAAARARAAKIRFGETAFITWWRSAASSPAPLEHLPLSPGTGVHAFTVSRPCCEVLRSYLEEPANYDDNGFLKMGDTQYPGYGAYPHVHAPLGQIARLQERRTVRVTGRAQVRAVLESVVPLRHLVSLVRRALRLPEPGGTEVLCRSGKCIKALHFLLQDETEQASFSWHDDAYDLEISSKMHASEMTTVIVSLSEACSGMRVWGCEPVLYRQQGDAVAFPGAAAHETLPRRRNLPVPRVWKLALFFA